jgi:hypothetical protein
MNVAGCWLLVRGAFAINADEPVTGSPSQRTSNQQPATLQPHPPIFFKYSASMLWILISTILSMGTLL